MKQLKFFAVIMATVVMLASCQSMNNLGKGSLIGAGGGALLGAGIGHLAGNTAAGAIIGAAVGGATGAVIGNYMDKQVAEMQQDLQGAKVERIGEGIKITFDSGILFAVGKSNLSPQAQQNLADLSVILKKYADTHILVEGHTDDTGGNDLNQRLSEQRAQSVANFLMRNDVLGSRLQTVGYGEEQPIVENNSAANRALNRRVEIAIYANDKLKRAAERGQI
ncbi:OmpA family protein [Prolixibacteraceae bacterium JC049]|nr:OmpA family protein [Prolixibacteraceae bacterium JC049]